LPGILDPLLGSTPLHLQVNTENYGGEVDIID
jgi:hypothetical protein